MGIHWQELIVILLIVLVLFGPKRLPEIGSSLGKGINGFRRSLNGLDDSKPAAHAATIVSAQDAATTTTTAAPAPVEVVAAAPANTVSDEPAH
jgi:sec-independent protein translocase protein TatA